DAAGEFVTLGESRIPLWQSIVAAVFLAGISVFAIGMRRRMPYLFVGWFWYVGTLIPVSGLVQLGGQARADRYTYIPLIGLFVAVVLGLFAPSGAPPCFKDSVC